MPIGAAVAIAVLATVLLSLGPRSPYTHANLAPELDPRYTRTEQVVVDEPAPYSGPGLVAPLAAGDLIARGRALLVTRGCASCHGLAGQGGSVGPPIAGFDLETLQDKVHKGPGGMPAYHSGEIGDEDLAAVVAYLQSVGKQKDAGDTPAKERTP
ncbi:MAG: cytochrome c [Chloroflexi bacterium]|nr:cytochrome c [Chloroflexota bacterium]